MNIKAKPIVIIGAMEVEIDFLIEKLENLKENIILNYHFYEGTINTYPVVVAESKVGTINAAAVTTIAIEYYHPICIINQGTAGAIGKEIHTKDIVIGSEILHMMSAKTPYREIGEGSNSIEWDYITFVSGGVDEKVTQKANTKLLAFFKQCTQEYTQGKAHVGVIGSGDVWDREKDRLIYFNQIHQVLCKEMEGISVYTIANENNIPVINIRIISDNELLGEPYDRNIGKAVQEFVYESVKKMIEKII